MTNNGNDQWTPTYSGGIFHPLDPRPEEVLIGDIAHHLSNNCRFVGAVKTHFSIAQHSVIVSSLVPEQDALWGLLHDASEAYLSDISRPVKRFLAGYEELEERLMRVVATKFGLPWPMPDSIRLADDICVCTEQRDLLKPGPGLCECPKGIKLLPDKIKPMSNRNAEQAFLARFYQLFGGVQ